MSKQTLAPFAPIRVLHPLHAVIGGIVIVATETRTGNGVHLSTVSTGKPALDRRLTDHMIQLFTEGKFRSRVKTAWKILKGKPIFAKKLN